MSSTYFVPTRSTPMYRAPLTIPTPAAPKSGADSDLFEAVLAERSLATASGWPVNPEWKAGSTEPRELRSVADIDAYVQRHGDADAPALLLELADHLARQIDYPADDPEAARRTSWKLRELARRDDIPLAAIRDAMTTSKTLRASTARTALHDIEAYRAVQDRLRTELTRAWRRKDAETPGWRDRHAATPTPTSNDESSRNNDMTSPAYTRDRSDLYSAERARGEQHTFFGDMFRAQNGDFDAMQRQQAFRAQSTGSATGLVVPQYMLDEYALVARTGRPTANACRHLDIPELGMQLVIPRSTTGASATSQATENTAASNTDEVWDGLTNGVVTITGEQDVSRQLLERGGPGVDLMVFTDIAGAYTEELDRQVIIGSGSSNQVLGILSTSGTYQASAFTAAVTVTSFWTKLAGAVSTIATLRKLAPDTVIMHPRRYTWLLAQVDSQGRPLVTPMLDGNGYNSMGSADPTHLNGTIMGLRIVVDPNMPTNVGTESEDQVIVMRGADAMLWEAPDLLPSQLRFDQTAGGSLTTKLLCYGYAAFTAGRYPTAFGVIGGNATTSGAGLIAPTW